MNLLKRFWVTFEFTDKDRAESVIVGLGYGCGVTAYSLDDAVVIIKRDLFINASMPEIREVVENVDLSTLDEKHVLPNIRPPADRGIWFPKTGFS